MFWNALDTSQTLTKCEFLTLRNLWASVCSKERPRPVHAVSRRTSMSRSRDIGIRVALGADHDRILRSVFGHACAMTLAGIVIGSAFATAGIRVIHGMLYGIAAQGAGVLAVAAIALLVVAAGAASIPAWRAASIDPMRVLRDQ